MLAFYKAKEYSWPMLIRIIPNSCHCMGIISHDAVESWYNIVSYVMKFHAME